MTTTNETMAFPLSVRELKDRGCAVTGMPKSGKTNLAKLIVDHLLSNSFHHLFSDDDFSKGVIKFVIRCFDGSQSWLKSSIPYYVVIDDLYNYNFMDVPINENITFDISRLYPHSQALFVGQVLNSDFKYISNNMDKVNWWTIYIIEESQLVLPSGSLRARYAQATFRMVSVGRNYKQRYILLTQRPTDVSVKALSRVGIAYFGQHWEFNDIKRLSHLLCMDFKECRNKLAELKIGEFYYLNPYEKLIKKIQSPLFQTDVKPINYFDRPQQKTEKKHWWNRIFK